MAKQKAEVDVLIATERALVVQKAADLAHARIIQNSYHAPDDIANLTRDCILALANQNLLQEHDAALRDAEAEKYHEKWRQSVLLLKGDIAKLEAENTGLRELALAAAHALRSYQYGNASSELAEEIAAKLEGAL